MACYLLAHGASGFRKEHAVVLSFCVHQQEGIGAASTN
jgi:hypothetical protein